MTNIEVVELFYNNMANEILNSPADETLQEILMSSLKEVQNMVIETLDACK